MRKSIPWWWWYSGWLASCMRGMHAQYFTMRPSRYSRTLIENKTGNYSRMKIRSIHSCQHWLADQRGHDPVLKLLPESELSLTYVVDIRDKKVGMCPPRTTSLQVMPVRVTDDVVLTCKAKCYLVNVHRTRSGSGGNIFRCQSVRPTVDSGHPGLTLGPRAKFRVHLCQKRQHLQPSSLGTAQCIWLPVHYEGVRYMVSDLLFNLVQM